jgi:hypothetical protein
MGINRDGVSNGTWGMMENDWKEALAHESGHALMAKYQLLYVGDGAKLARLATESDVQEGVTATPNGKHIPVAISAPATAQGLRILYRGPEQTFFDAPLHAYLRTAVFGGDQLRSIYAPPLLFGFLSLLAQLPFAIRKDIRRRKELKYGRRLKGPVLLTPKEFNKTVNGDGIGFVTTEAKEMMRIAPGRSGAPEIKG